MRGGDLICVWCYYTGQNLNLYMIFMKLLKITKTKELCVF